MCICALNTSPAPCQAFTLRASNVRVYSYEPVVYRSSFCTLSLSLEWSVSYCSQVDNIAPMFDLDPSRPVWIVRKNGNYHGRDNFWPPLVTVGGEGSDIGCGPPTRGQSDCSCLFFSLWGICFPNLLQTSPQLTALSDGSSPSEEEERLEQDNNCCVPEKEKWERDIKGKCKGGV